uniref:cell adhesion molecule CEACAM5-like isoform X2 n=1 Tax=Pristiophorus japonicus TaxID=55135 RepID=UPI00398EDC25
MRGHGFPLLVCTLFTASVKSQFLAIVREQQSVEAATGTDVLLNLWPSPTLRSGSWSFNCTDVAFWIGNATDINNNYSGRAQLLADGSLSLMSLTVSDSGRYFVTMNPSLSNHSLTSYIDLNVLEPVSKPEIVASVSQILEYNGTVTLTCNLTGDSLSIRWIKDGQYIQYNDRMNVSSDNHTLTITAVNRSDSGNYLCAGHNPVSNATSDPLFLTVYYGPEEPQMSIDPDKRGITLGSNVTFTCSVQSVPPPEFEWFFRGQPLQQQCREMIIANIGLEHSGNYTCQAFNNMTRQYTNVTKGIDVIEPVSKPRITTDVLYPIEDKDRVTMTCNVTGDVKFLYWFKADQFIQNNERIMVSVDNVTMSITALNRSDSGNYSCQAWGDRNNETSDPFPLNISYGPDAPQLIIEEEKEAYIRGSNVAFKCSADSVPPAAFEWLLNGISLQWGSQELVIFNITTGDFGNYTCKAYNNRTKMYAISTKLITEVDISKPRLAANPLHPIEHNDTVTLSCDVSGDLYSLVWSRNQNVLADSENTKLSKDNKTLTISAVARSDAGNYTCTAESPIGNKESDLLQLIVYYGPDKPQILTNPKEQIFYYGSNVTLTCTVESLPSPEINWYINGTSFPQQGNKLIVTKMSRNDSGNYTCETYNKKTNLRKWNSIQIILSETKDLQDYENKSWIAAAVIGLLVFIAICACVIFRKRNPSG